AAPAGRDDAPGHDAAAAPGVPPTAADAGPDRCAGLVRPRRRPGPAHSGSHQPAACRGEEAMSPREDSQFSSGWQTRSGVRPRSTASGSVATRASQDTAEPIWDPKGLNDDPAVRNYVLVCLAALVVLLVALLYQDVGTVSLAPVLVGMLGVVTR